MRKCSKCGIEKEESEFNKEKTHKDGLSSWCKDCYRVYNKTDKRKEYQRRRRMTEEYKKYHREYQREHQAEYVKRKKAIDPKLKLGGNVSSAIYKALKGKKAGRKWEELVGYSVEDLMKHIEKQFEQWMNWDNYGKWHIDHIKPQSLFNYTSAEDEEFKQCWSLDNLQPLEAIENIKKGNKS